MGACAELQSIHRGEEVLVRSEACKCLEGWRSAGPEWKRAAHLEAPNNGICRDSQGNEEGEGVDVRACRGAEHRDCCIHHGERHEKICEEAKESKNLQQAHMRGSLDASALSLLMTNEAAPDGSPSPLAAGVSINHNTCHSCILCNT